MGEHQSKWMKSMVAKYGSEEAVSAFQSANAKKAKRTGKGGFAHMKQHNPDKLRTIASKGGRSGKRTKKI